MSAVIRTTPISKFPTRTLLRELALLSEERAVLLAQVRRRRWWQVPGLWLPPLDQLKALEDHMALVREVKHELERRLPPF